MKSPFRTRIMLVTATAVALVAGLALPAGAEVPEGWSNPDKVDALHALLILGGIPLTLFVLIGLAVYLPSVVRGEGVAPHQGDELWLGGSDKTVGELESAQAGKVNDDETGGGSGTW